MLDQLVTAAYDPVSPHRAAANKALMQLQETPDLWTKADSIIENSNVPQCRFFGLQILDDAIKSRYVVFSMHEVRWYIISPFTCMIRKLTYLLSGGESSHRTNVMESRTLL